MTSINGIVNEHSYSTSPGSPVLDINAADVLTSCKDDTLNEENSDIRECSLIATSDTLATTIENITATPQNETRVDHKHCSPAKTNVVQFHVYDQLMASVGEEYKTQNCELTEQEEEMQTNETIIDKKQPTARFEPPNQLEHAQFDQAHPLLDAKDPSSHCIKNLSSIADTISPVEDSLCTANQQVSTNDCSGLMDYSETRTDRFIEPTVQNVLQVDHAYCGPTDTNIVQVYVEDQLMATVTEEYEAKVCNLNEKNYEEMQSESSNVSGVETQPTASSEPPNQVQHAQFDQARPLSDATDRSSHGDEKLSFIANTNSPVEDLPSAAHKPVSTDDCSSLMEYSETRTDQLIERIIPEYKEPEQDRKLINQKKEVISVSEIPCVKEQHTMSSELPTQVRSLQCDPDQPYTWPGDVNQASHAPFTDVNTPIKDSPSTAQHQVHTDKRSGNEAMMDQFMEPIISERIELERNGGLIKREQQEKQLETVNDALDIPCVITNSEHPTQVPCSEFDQPHPLPDDTNQTTCIRENMSSVAAVDVQNEYVHRGIDIDKTGYVTSRDCGIEAIKSYSQSMEENQIEEHFLPTHNAEVVSAAGLSRANQVHESQLDATLQSPASGNQKMKLLSEIETESVFFTSNDQSVMRECKEGLHLPDSVHEINSSDVTDIGVSDGDNDSQVVDEPVHPLVENNCSSIRLSCDPVDIVSVTSEMSDFAQMKNAEFHDGYPHFDHKCEKECMGSGATPDIYDPPLFHFPDCNDSSETESSFSSVEKHPKVNFLPFCPRQPMDRRKDELKHGFFCRICRTLCPSITVLKRHIKLEHSPMDFAILPIQYQEVRCKSCFVDYFICLYCCRSYFSVKRMVKHFEKHQLRSCYRCRLCKEKFFISSRWHLFSHKTRTVCKICQRNDEGDVPMNASMKISLPGSTNAHSSSNEVAMEPASIEQPCLTDVSLDEINLDPVVKLERLPEQVVTDRMAILEFTGGKWAVKIPNYPVKNESADNTIHKNDKYKCRICEKQFMTSVLLEDHVAYLHSTDETREDCDDVIVVAKDVVVNAAGRILCQFCHEKFRSKNKYFEHIEYVHDYQIDHPSKPYKCHKCPDTFVSRKGLHSHIKRHYYAGSRQRCNLCKKYLAVRFKNHRCVS